MKPTILKVLGASMLTFALALGGSMSPQQKVVKESRQTLESMLDSVGQVRAEASRLLALTRSTLNDPESYASQMEMIKGNFNVLNRELQSLQKDRASLAPWEQKTLDEVVPLLKETSEATTKAIDYYNQHRNDLISPTYRAEADQIYTHAVQADQKLGESLKLAKLRHEQARVKAELATSQSK